MKTLVQSYFSEDSMLNLRADIFEEQNGFNIEYSKYGDVFKREQYPSKTLIEVKNIASDWANNLKVLK